MSETLWIKLAAASGGPLAWARVDAAARVLARGHALPADLPPGTPCKLVVAADKVLWTRFTPPGRRRLDGAALAYALEDRLADNPEAVHAVMGPVRKDGTAAVAVVDQAWLAEHLAALEQAGLRPDSAVAEPALLPGSDAEWHLIWGESPVLSLTDGLCLQLSAEPAEAQQLLTLVVNRGEPRPERLVLHAAAGHALPEGDLFGQGAAIETSVGADYDWAAAAQAAGRPEVELLKGRFARRGQGSPDLQRWRPVAWLAVALAGVNVVGLMANAGLNTWEAHRIQRADRALFQTAFPEVKVVLDPVLQMRRQMALLNHTTGTASATDFLPMLERVGALLPAGVRSSVREVRYRPGALVLVLPVGQTVSADWRQAGFRASRRPSEEKGWDELTLEVGT